MGAELASSVYYCNPLASNDDAHLQQEIKESSIQSKTTKTHMSMNQLHKLKVTDKIDHRNAEGKFIGATIVAKNETKLKIRYETSDECKNNIWSDYFVERHKFAIYRSISKKKLNKHKYGTLETEDDVDVNPIYNGHPGWRCGAIDEVDTESCQVNVVYEVDDGEYHTIWIDLENNVEISTTGSKVNPLQMLRRHYYDPFFNLKNNKHNKDLIVKKALDCFNYIRNDIIHEKKNNITSVIEYLDRMRYELYEDKICCEIRELVTDEQFMKIDEAFVEMYSLFVNDLKIATDKFHLHVSKETYTIDMDNVKDEQKHIMKSKETLKTMKNLKIKWNVIKTIKQKQRIKCNERTNLCPSVQRIKFLLKLFDNHFIKYYQHKTNNDTNVLDFMLLYNKCINTDSNDCATEIINDCHHIQQQHMFNVQDVIGNCEYKSCVRNKRDADATESCFGYKLKEEIAVIQLMVKYHTYFKHRTAIDPTLTQIQLIDNNRFTTEIIENDTENKEALTEQMMPTFGFGEMFFYSKHFEHHAHYIKSTKYPTLKEELLNNNIMSISLSKFVSFLQKAIMHSSCYTAKHLTAHNRGEENTKMQVPVHFPITISQLLCIIIYTDTDKEQCEFKKYACRQNTTGKSLKERKKLNAEIGNWYWLFCQTVYLYGDDTNPKTDKFFHGLDCKFLFASFRPWFECPISTTNRIAVAQGFAIGGIILQLNPTVSSSDKYLSVSWISAHPEESEYIFCAATSLSINDIRFTDNDIPRIQVTNMHKNHLAALRLFDCIVSKNCSYEQVLLKQKTQRLLTRYLKYDTSLDEINEFFSDDENNLSPLKTFINDSEYDTDCIRYDMDGNNNSNILKEIRTINEKKAVLFQNHYKKQLELVKIPTYLRSMFSFMKQCLLEWISQKNQKIYRIHTEYQKLNPELRNELSKLYSDSDVIFIEEFEWQIKKDAFHEFNSLKRGKQLNGPNFEWRASVNDDEFVIFHPIILKSDATFPTHSAIGITIDSIPSNMEAKWFRWSFSVQLKKKYSWDSERTIEAEVDMCDRLKAFSHDDLNGLSELTVKIYIRTKKYNY